MLRQPAPMLLCCTSLRFHESKRWTRAYSNVGNTWSGLIVSAALLACCTHPSVPIGALESLLTVVILRATVERMKGSVMVSLLHYRSANGQPALTSCSLRVHRMLCRKQWRVPSSCCLAFRKSVSANEPAAPSLDPGPPDSRSPVAARRQRKVRSQVSSCLAVVCVFPCADALPFLLTVPTAVWSSTSKSHHTQAREDPAVLLTAGVALCAAAACRKKSIW